MQEFNIELPKEVLDPGKHQFFDTSLLNGKTIIGLMGYAKSGKDTITKTFIDDYGYKRVAFADNIKTEMNKYLKQAVCDDINNKINEEIKVMRESGKMVKVKYFTPEDIDFFTEDLELKKVIRPYVIWYGEKLRNINGRFCWINRAFAEDGKGVDKLVLSDVRRLAELDIFRNSNEFSKRYKQSMLESGYSPNSLPAGNNYGTLLFEVSQFGLTDGDNLTVETIQMAHEQWLVDDTFYVDSRIPDSGNYRNKAIELQIKRIVKKFGIEKPEKTKFEQTNIFQVPGV